MNALVGELLEERSIASDSFKVVSSYVLVFGCKLENLSCNFATLDFLTDASLSCLILTAVFSFSGEIEKEYVSLWQ